MKNIREFESLKNKVIFGKYKAVKIIGRGSFGCVFQGMDIKTKKYVALKVENKNSESNLLKIEASFLSFLKGYGIPKIISYGNYYNFRVMVQEILGFNLMQIKKLINRFSIKDIAMMGIQMMDRIEFIHSKHLIHRDIKPENFTTGYEDISTIYLIDYGISRKYRSSRTGNHVRYCLTGRMFGTVRYASYNASRGVEQSRRDDLESIGNMLIFIYTGKLPWKGISLKDNQRKKKYLEMLLLKKFTPPEEICKNMPKKFVEYYKYCKNLNFEQDPDYEYLRNIFRSILMDNCEINDFKFSWIHNKNYLKEIKSYNNKLNIIDIKKEKYINIFKRTNSPGNRLYHIIKKSLEKTESDNYKKTVGNSENLVSFHNNMNSNLDLESVKTFNRVESENVIKISNNNDISENQNNVDKTKYDLTYKSEISQYNMDVDEFQDEAKICEQNKTLINKIKNSKNENLNNHNKNLNITDLRSYEIVSSNKNNKCSKKDLLKKYRMNNNNNSKLNISIDLGVKNHYKDTLIQTKIYYEFRPSSERKNNFYKISILTEREKKIKFYQEQLYNHIMSKINIYMNNLQAKRIYQKNKIKQNTNTKIYISKHPKIKTEKNTKNDIISQNFSFKNINIGKNLVNNDFANTFVMQNQQRNNNFLMKKHQQEMKITKAINQTKININNNKNNTNPKEINNITQKLPTKNYLENNRRINIIINNNLNGFTKSSSKNKNNNNLIQKKNIYQVIPTNPNIDNMKKKQIDLNKQKKIINKNNIYIMKENRDNNFMKKIQKQNNKILIPKQLKPMNQIFGLNNHKKNNNYISPNDKYFLMINSRNIISKINNNQNQTTNYIKTYEYKSVLNKKQNSADKYINNKRKISTKKGNNLLINIKNQKLNKLTKNNSYDSIQKIAHFPQKFKKMSLSDLNQITNKDLFNLKLKNYELIDNKKKHFIIKHYSPDVTISKNKKRYIMMKDEYLFNRTGLIRGNSDSKNKKVLNYNISNINCVDSNLGLNHKPLNINNLNTYIFNQSETKCFNKMKI